MLTAYQRFQSEPTRNLASLNLSGLADDGEDQAGLGNHTTILLNAGNLTAIAISRDREWRPRCKRKRFGK